MARSEGLLLSWIVPCVKSGVIDATCTPKPICRGFVPPLLPTRAEPRLCVCKNCVANCACDALNPTVAELARLLPTTSIVVSAAVRPVNAVLSADAKPIAKLLRRKCNFVFRAALAPSVNAHRRSAQSVQINWQPSLTGPDLLLVIAARVAV